MLTNFPNGITSFGIPITGASRVDPSGTVYFVDGNCGNDTSDGLSWDYPMKTLTHAFAVSHANIASASNRWARRNTIFIAGDDFAETLVTLPQKTDVIGVGSSDPYKKACIRGNHAPVNTAMGCRFINVRFRPAASSDLMALVSTTSGVEFINCKFDAHYGAFTAPSAIQATGVQFLKIQDCEFIGAFSGDTIDIAAGRVDQLRIVGNTISGGANDGIVVSGTTTIVQGRMGLIADNYVQVAGFIIKDGDDNTINVVRNRGVSAGVGTANAYEIDEGLAVDNVFTYNDGTSVRVPIIPSA